MGKSASYNSETELSPIPAMGKISAEIILWSGRLWVNFKKKFPSLSEGLIVAVSSNWFWIWTPGWLTKRERELLAGSPKMYSCFKPVPPDLFQEYLYKNFYHALWHTQGFRPSQCECKYISFHQCVFSVFLNRRKTAPVNSKKLCTAALKKKIKIPHKIFAISQQGHPLGTTEMLNYEKREGMI